MKKGLVCVRDPREGVSLPAGSSSGGLGDGGVVVDPIKGPLCVSNVSSHFVLTLFEAAGADFI